jgi:signal peptidase I
MVPALKPGAVVQVAVDRAYAPSVGDIVYFHPPAGADAVQPVCGNPNQGAGHAQACDKPTAAESSQTFIKRVVAGPGDKVFIENGHVYRNGVRESDSYIEPCGADPSCNFRAPITIPPGDYFVLGDNRGLSDDSRFWGPVPRSYIIGMVLR